MNKKHYTRRRLFVLVACLTSAASINAYAEASASPTQPAQVVSSDQAIANQLDEQAKKLVIDGKFAEALEKLEAAEIMVPDAERARRVERIRAFVDIRKGVKPLPDPAAKAAPATSVASPAGGEDQKTSAIAAETDDQLQQTADQAQQGVAQTGQAVKKHIEKSYDQYPPEEARVRKVLDSFISQIALQFQSDEQAGGDGLHLIINEEYRLAKDGDAYIATLEPFNLVDKRNEGLYLGPVQVTLRPDSAEVMALKMTFPDNMSIKERDKVVANIHLQSQNLQGVWNEQLEMFESATGRLQGIEIKGVDEPNLIKVNDVSFTQQLHGKDAEIWKQIMRAGVQGVHVETYKRSGEKETELALEKISINGHVVGKDLKEMQRLTKQIQDDAEQLALAQDASVDSPILKDAMAMMDLFHAYDFDISVENLSLEEDGQDVFSLGKMGWKMALSKQQSGTWSVNARFGFNELKAAPQPGVPPQLVPDAFTFQIDLDNFPPKLFQSAIEAGDDPQKQAQLQGLLMQKLQEYQTSLSLKDVLLHYPDYSLSLGGKATVHPQSPYMSVGEVDLSIVNLPKVMEVAKEMGVPPGVSKMLASLALASQRTEEVGKVTDSYHLQWGADGKVLLNGKDASALMAPEPEQQGAAATTDNTK